jgi:hypothetical protein
MLVGEGFTDHQNTQKMLIALRSPRGHALKVDRSLFDPIVELKVDWPEIQVYLHVSLI